MTAPSITSPAENTGDAAQDAAVTDREETPAEEAPELVPPGRIPVKLLVPHPKNARKDPRFTPEFLASVAAEGVTDPVHITPLGDGTYRIIDGWRRWLAATKAGHTDVPYHLAGDRADDEAGQFLDMVTLNQLGEPLTAIEVADALFSASEAGARTARIRKATGLDKQTVDAALKAGRLTGPTRDKAAAYQGLDLCQLALLQEFEDEPMAVERLLRDMSLGRTGEHEAQLIRDHRAAQAEHERLLTQFRDDGYQVTDGGNLPDGAMQIGGLLHDGEALTPETHAGCPGRGVYFLGYDPAAAHHYCTAPAASGHSFRYSSVTTTSGTGAPGTPERPGTGPDEDSPDGSGGIASDSGRSHKAVVEGNLAWGAAAKVRKKRLTTLLARNKAPREAALFIARQLFLRPGPVRDKITAAPALPVFSELAGPVKAEQLEAWPAQRLPLLSLALICTAYEEQLGSERGRWTWREEKEKYSPCRREEAGAYFRFLRDIGHELSAIEQAVADGVPYAGEPGSQLAPETAADDRRGAGNAADDGSEQDEASGMKAA